MEIVYRNLGRTGVEVSPLCLGTMLFGRTTDEPEAHRIVHHALDNGINFLDTANVYGRGVSEEIVGRAIKGRRNEVVLATKVHGKMGEGPNNQGNSRRHILMQVEESLRRLDTDWIDLYQLHRPDPSTPLEEQLDALNDCVRAGKVRYLGVSEFPAWMMCEMLWIADRERWAPIVCDQPQFNILRRQVEREVAPFCLEHGIGIIPYSPLAGGLLSGKYKRGTPPPADSRAARNPGMAQRLSDAVLDVLEKLEARAKALGKTLSQYAIAWTLANPAVTSPIVGPRTFEQWLDNLGALGWEFPKEEVDFVNQLTDEIQSPLPIKIA
ncbi:MAG: aldo/keto reductase [Candidatus Sumerlaeota bacterium]|nr:aldo/keto reductase [Candidatus Sumerlaeota bacterium]